MVARGEVNQASNSPLPALPGTNSLNLAVRGARPTTAARSPRPRPATAVRSAQTAQTAGRHAADDNDGWTTAAAIRAARARNGQASSNAFIADGPLPSAGGAAPAQGTMPAVGRHAWITVQCPNDQVSFPGVSQQHQSIYLLW